MPDPAIELDRPNDTEADRIARLIGSLPRPQEVSGIAAQSSTGDYDAAARVHRGARKQGGVAGGGAGAAAPDPGGRLAQRPEFRNRCLRVAGVSPRTE